MQLIFAVLFGTIVGVSTGIFNLPLIPRLICYILLGTLAGILGGALANHLEKPAKTKNTLRQMMHERLRPSVITFRHGDIISFPGFRAGTTLYDISMQAAAGNGVPVMINHDTGGADLSVFPTANGESTPDISEAIATGEIKSSGKSVSAEDVIARIDKTLEENSQ